MHFGMEGIIGLVLYVGAIAALLMSVFWRPIVGLFYLVPLIPLQTIRYRLIGYPLGESIVGLMLLGVAVGVIRRHQSPLPKTPWTALLCIYAVYTFVSLLYGSFYLGVALPLPGDPRFSVWLDYMMMPALLLLVAAVEPTKRQIKALIVVMCVAVFLVDRNFWDLVSGRDFSAYSDDLRESGGMGYAGANGLAAFEAQITIFLLALAAFERRRLWWLGYFALAAFSGVCVMYSLSRGAYLALLVGWLFIGLTKQRKLLLLLVAFALTWTTLVPTAVQQRVMMTYDKDTGGLDHSAETRVTLWEDAVQIFDTNVAMGTGFNTYAYMHRVGSYEDTHNFYLKVLVETGVVGLLIFLWLLARTFWTGCRLWRRARDPFLNSLGLGLAAWVVCAMVANLFGDRWSFLQVGGYMWVIAGLVARGLVLEQDGATAAVADGDAQPAREPKGALAVAGPQAVGAV